MTWFKKKCMFCEEDRDSEECHRVDEYGSYGSEQKYHYHCSCVKKAVGEPETNPKMVDMALHILNLLERYAAQEKREVEQREKNRKDAIKRIEHLKDFARSL